MGYPILRPNLKYMGPSIHHHLLLVGKEISQTIASTAHVFTEFYSIFVLGFHKNAEQIWHLTRRSNAAGTLVDYLKVATSHFMNLVGGLNLPTCDFSFGQKLLMKQNDVDMAQIHLPSGKLT